MADGSGKNYEGVWHCRGCGHEQGGVKPARCPNCNNATLLFAYRETSGLFRKCRSCQQSVDVKYHPNCTSCGVAFPAEAPYEAAILRARGGGTRRPQTPPRNAAARQRPVIRDPAAPTTLPPARGKPGAQQGAPSRVLQTNARQPAQRPVIRDPPPPARLPPPRPPPRGRTPASTGRPAAPVRISTSRARTPPAPARNIPPRRAYTPPAAARRTPPPQLASQPPFWAPGRRPASPHSRAYYPASPIVVQYGPSSPRVAVPPNPVWSYNVGSPRDPFAPLTFADLRRKTGNGVALVCMDCGHPWTRNRCAHCSRASPIARAVLHYVKAPPPAHVYTASTPARLRHRARSPHPRRGGFSYVAPDAWPDNLDWQAQVAPYHRARSSFDDILENRVPPSSMVHPAGHEALVGVSGAPTSKLVSLCKSIHIWLQFQVPGPTDFIDPQRLYLLELETENYGVFYIYREAFHSFVFEELGIEYLDFWDANTQSSACGITLRGLIRYITLWILCEPRDSTACLARLVNKLDFPPPPGNRGPKWRIDASQTLAFAHPTAEKWRAALHEKLLTLDDDPLENPLDPGLMLWETPY